jgi:hypothetical protein
MTGRENVIDMQAHQRERIASLVLQALMRDGLSEAEALALIEIAMHKVTRLWRP